MIRIAHTSQATRRARAARLSLPAALIAATIVIVMPATAARAQDAATEAAEVDTVALAALSPEELFLRSSSAALQFAPMIQPSRRILVREHGRSIPYLVTQLDTDGPRERQALEDILVKIGEPAVGPLIEALCTELEREDTTRGATMAAGILGRLGDDRATTALSKAALHDDWKVRSSVAGSLGRIGSPDGLTGLLGLLTDENEIVRKSSAVSLKRMAMLDGVRSDKVVRALAVALADRYYSVRYSAAAALTEFGSDALPALTGVALYGSGPARLVALSAVGRIADAAALGMLDELLSDSDWAVRGYAAEAIGRIGADRRARKALSALLAEETHPFVIMRAGDALAPM